MRNYPSVPVRPVTDEYFGVKVEDPYRYIEDANSEETLAIVAAENKYTRRFFDEHARDMVAEKERELRARKPMTDISSVAEVNGMICATRELDGGVHDIVSLNEALEFDHVIVDEAMLDNAMHVFLAKPCPGEKGIYAVMGVIHGHPRCCCVIWDDNRKKQLAVLDDNFGFTWSHDGESILYCETLVDKENQRNVSHVRRYHWREDRNEILYTHPETTVWIDVSEAPDGGVLMHAMNTYVDILVMYRSPEGEVTRLTDGRDTYNYIGAAGGKLLFKTNARAPFAKLVAIRPEQLSQAGSLLDGCEEVLPESDCLLNYVAIVPDGLMAQYERDACSELRLYDLDGNKLRDIPLPDRYSTASFAETGLTPDAATEVPRRLFFSYQSYTCRPSLMAMDAATMAITCVKGDTRDTSDVEVEQVFLNARDGQRILCYMVRPKGLVPNGETPTMIYGYGGYAVSETPHAEDVTTCVNVVDWVRKGRIYVGANLRGGLEYGTAWHEAAMMKNKKNAFFDFIDIAEHMVKTGWTKPSRIVATGLSNGGLLMTAVTTLRPDLFGTVIASVPHTDMLRFRNDDRGMMYVTEYGDPLADREMFEYIRSYSPYANIHEGVLYPWIYVQTGEKDNNVPPYHGKKFAVRLQAAADERHPVLLTVLAHGSHDRGVGDEFYMNVSRMQSFIELSLAAQA